MDRITASDWASSSRPSSITSEDILDHFHRAVEEGFLPCREVIDVPGVTLLILSRSELWRTALLVRVSPTENFGRRAFIAPEDEVYRLIAFFLSFLSAFLPMHVFRERNEAEEWSATGTDRHGGH
jgi:hypothetical protein